MTIVVMNPYAYRNMPDKYLIYQMNLQSRDKTDTKFEILIQFYFHFFYVIFIVFFFSSLSVVDIFYEFVSSIQLDAQSSEQLKFN